MREDQLVDSAVQARDDSVLGLDSTGRCGEIWFGDLGYIWKEEPVRLAERIGYRRRG